MKHHKRIVLDFDDTLAFPVNRDFKNAKPNKLLINKINKLHKAGWQIDIFTARGSISCETRADAEAKYGEEIRQWLFENQVDYDTLSFDKPLAAYYVDDKGISPEDFIDTDIRNLEGGLSGSDIYTDGRLVHKTDAKSHEVNEWFEVVKKAGVSVPNVERVVGETMTMEYIEHDNTYFYRMPHRALALVQENLEKLKKIEYTGNPRKFTTYMERIREHINDCEIEQDVLWALVWDELKLSFWPEESFSHGDFGITNMLFEEDHLTLIDPIPDVFGCLELDIAKFIASLYINKAGADLIDLARRTLCTYNKLKETDINILVRCELTRVIKYHHDKEFIIGLIQDVY